MMVCVLRLGAGTWAAFDTETGDLVDEGVAGPLPACDQLWAIVPGMDVTARTVELPPQANTRARAAVAFLLEDDLAADGENLHFALDGAATPARMVAVVARARMDAWLGQLAALGVKADMMAPDYLALPMPALRECAGIVLARTADGGFAAETELAAWLVEDSAPAVSPRALMQEMFATLRAGAAINLLQGPYAPRRNWAGLRHTWRRTALLAASLLALAVVGQLAEAWHYSRRAAAAEARAEVLFRRAMPEVKRVVNPRAQIRARVQEARASDSAGFLRMGNILFSAVSAVDNVELESLRFDGKRGEMSFALSLPSFEAVERIKAEIARQGGTVQEGGARQDGPRIHLDMVLRLL